MNNKWIKGVSITLCAALAIGAAGVGIHAANGDGGDGGSSSESYPAESVAVVRVPAELVDSADENSESVYVLLGADGTAQRVITSSEDGGLNYDGDVNALPVTMRVTYALDGVETAPAALAGKSGHVTIRFDYENHQRASDGTLVPFAVMTGVLLDGDTFSNVSVTNGRLINDGSRVAAVGAAFPGLQESLGLDADTFELPSYVEISADTTDFSLESTYSLVTNAVFSDVDTENMNSLDDLEDASDKLTDAMGKLEDGSDTLYDGLVTLGDGVTQYTDGVGALADGLNTLSGNSAALGAGARQVFDALLGTANEQIAASGLELPALTVDNYADVLTGALGSLNADGVEATARAKVEQAVRAQEDTVRAAVTEAVQAEVGKQVAEAVKTEVRAKVEAAVKAGVAEKVLAAANLTPETYEAALAAGQISAEQQAQIEGAIDQQMAGEQVKAMIEAKLAEQMASREVAAIVDAKTAEQMASGEVAAIVDAKTEEQIAKLVEQNMASEEVQAQIAAGLAQAGEGAEKLGALKAQLDSYNSFYQGLLRYTGGVDSAAAGARELSGNTPKLIEGVTALRDGAKELSDGLREFDREGIRKVTDALDGDVTSVLGSVKDVCSASREYRSFSGDEDIDAVRFIYRTDAIGK